VDIRPLFLCLTAVVDSKVKASKSGASDSPNRKDINTPAVEALIAQAVLLY